MVRFLAHCGHIFRFKTFQIRQLARRMRPLNPLGTGISHAQLRAMSSRKDRGRLGVQAASALDKGGDGGSSCPCPLNLITISG